MGATDILVHKYLGPQADPSSTSAITPANTNQSVLNIQDLLFVENRDRVYEPDVYKLRGIYNVTDQDFDLSQFGLFLTAGTLFITFHINDMVQALGRKIMNGDVLELVHLTDYFALNTDLPTALKRFYVVSDCTNSSEGFSPTWWPHLWRCKMSPLVDSQEFKQITNAIIPPNDNGGVNPGNVATPLGDLLSTLNTYTNINDAVVQQAEQDVPASGYDTSKLYMKPVDGPSGSGGDVITTADDFSTTSPHDIDAAGGAVNIDNTIATPDGKVEGYLTGDGTAPNGLPVGAGINFPTSPLEGDYFLRLDYVPNRLFRYNGARWVKIEDNVRTSLTPGAPANRRQVNTFVDNPNVWVGKNTDPKTNAPEIVQERQSLSKAFRPKSDN